MAITKFKVGDRVRVYGYSNRGGNLSIDLGPFYNRGTKAEIIEVDIVLNFCRVRFLEAQEGYVSDIHPKQLTRLVKKKPTITHSAVAASKDYKFQKGDTIRCIDAVAESGFLQNALYTVAEAQTRSYVEVVQDEDGDSNSWGAHHFELVNKAPVNKHAGSKFDVFLEDENIGLDYGRTEVTCAGFKCPTCTGEKYEMQIVCDGCFAKTHIAAAEKTESVESLIHTANAGVDAMNRLHRDHGDEIEYEDQFSSGAGHWASPSTKESGVGKYRLKPEPKTEELHGWVNVYLHNTSEVYGNKEDAEAYKGDGRIACVEVGPIEYKAKGE